uniref:Integrase catalytic domain-containing protein n=1 Tax=Caulerpa ashmeadii TaxID=177078 RepID=A0A6B9VWW9_9CHLO|nr:hypothetical protein [Caulerpa ashmeadii]QHQ73213.1 hypothetical protein [Caulerpa ashmeadii]
MHIFPNELDNRNVVALPNTVFVADSTSLPVKHRKKPLTGFKALLIIDLATGEIVGHRVFCTKGPRASIPSRRVVQLFQRALATKQLPEQFIIHTDRGPEFASQAFADFVRQIGAIGSMSNPQRPTDNAVAERTIRTIKHQLLEHTPTLPTAVSALGPLQIALEKRITFWNTQFMSRRAGGTTPSEAHRRLEMQSHKAPDIQLTHANGDRHHTDLQTFKTKAIAEHPYLIISETRLLAQNLANSQAQRFAAIEEKLDRLLAQNKKLSKSVPKLPLRDPASGSIYEWIMNLPREPRCKRLPYMRFRLAITLLRFTGMRANEVGNLQRQQIDSAVRLGHIDVRVTKTKQVHRYVINPSMKKRLRNLEVERDIVFAQHDRIKGTLNPKNWIAFLNIRLKPVGQHFGINLKSHSFRTGFITQLLRICPVQHVASMVGHRDVRSTQVYNRFVPDRTETHRLLEAIHSGPEESVDPNASESTMPSEEPDGPLADAGKTRPKRAPGTERRIRQKGGSRAPARRSNKRSTGGKVR